MIEDIIAAISTSLGEGAIGIVRLSGKGTFTLVEKIFRSPSGKKLSLVPTHSVNYGHIIDPKTNQKIDEVLVTVMKGPRTFTTEDIIEINCHGGIIPLRRILELVLQHGARMAEPGEFAKRAFLNGRIDLAQAESIIDIIRAKTGTSLQVAINQLEGNLSVKIKALRRGVLELIAFIEAGIDFPEHDIEEITIAEITQRTKQLSQEVRVLIDGAETGKVYREGLSTVIIGKTNVGKSSLLNALLKEKRAIVTDIPGTTRDLIEEYLNIKGIPLKIVDTAGIRRTEDFVERIGIEKSKEIFSGADFVLLVLDSQTGITNEDLEIIEMLHYKPGIIIINKTDVGERIALENLPQSLQHLPVIKMAITQGVGIEALESKIVEIVQSGKVSANSSCLVSNVRHKDALDRAYRYLNEVITTIELGMPTDCMAIDLKGAWEALGEISGETVGEEIIDLIFSSFCLGK